MNKITNILVCKAYVAYNVHRQDKKLNESFKYPYDFLMEWTNQSEDVCLKAMEKAVDAGYIDYGVSLRTGWLTDKGHHLLRI